jgi:hypothetical protein
VYTVWHGSDDDLVELQNAVQRNCTCPVPSQTNPAPPLTCPAHAMLLDQATLDRLNFTKGIADKLNAEEHRGKKRP